jgi:cytochrome P450
MLRETKKVDRMQELATASPTKEPVSVTTFQEVKEAWKCPHLSADTGGEGSDFFHTGTVVRIDGEMHRTRRRAMGRLLKQHGHKQFRDTALIPTSRALLDEVLSAPDADGYARTDLIQWGRRASFRLGAAMVGFDAGRSGDSAEELVELMGTLLAGRPGNAAITLGQSNFDTPAFRAAVQARNEIIERYYRPALARRRELAAQLAAGRIGEDELPVDLIMLIALEADPAWQDEAVAEREALFLFNAGVHTTTVSLQWAIRELFEWLQTHPEGRARLTEDAFLLRVLEESMRLHPVTAGFPRRAQEHVEFSGGTAVDPGQLIVIRSGPAGIDTAEFGPDALSFDPTRAVPRGTANYAFAFGAGAHQCFGLPIVMGAQGLDGSLMHMFRLLLGTGLEIDPDGPPPESPAGARGGHEGEPKTFAVRFPVSVR